MSPADGSAPELREIDRFSVPDGPDGVGWIAASDGPIQRAAHALARDGDVWLVDPVDAAGLADLVEDLGTVAGVTLLLDRHQRDAAALARRFDVPVFLPRTLAPVAEELDAPTEVFDGELGTTGFEARALVDNRFWREAALYEAGSGTLVVPESVGTIPFFCAPGERLGVHPVLRVRPPKGLGTYAPERVLVGHGAGVHENADDALHRALSRARRTAPRLYWQTLRSAVPI